MEKDLDISGAHWQFSIAVYGEPDVSDACLYLQDNYSVDVNILLVGIYGAIFHQFSCSRQEIEKLDEAVQQLSQSVIIPLRKIRKDMKNLVLGPTGDAIRSAVKKNELSAEQLEQAILANILNNYKPTDRGITPAEAVVRIVHYFVERSKKAVQLKAESRKFQSGLDALTKAAMKHSKHI